MPPKTLTLSVKVPYGVRLGIRYGWAATFTRFALACSFARSESKVCPKNPTGQAEIYKFNTDGQVAEHVVTYINKKRVRA